MDVGVERVMWGNAIAFRDVIIKVHVHVPSSLFQSFIGKVDQILGKASGDWM